MRKIALYRVAQKHLLGETPVGAEREGQALRDKRSAITAVQAVLLVLVLAGAAWLAYKLVGYHQAQQVYQSLEAAYANELDGSDDAPIDFVALQERYPDVVAWLKMDDVDVSYPIVQGDDNDHYLDYDATGQPSVSGSVFLDWRNKSLDTDLYALVYGHNMRDESMFGQLDEYLSEEFYAKGSGTFRIYTPHGTYRYKIFAVDVVDPSDDVYTMGFSNTQAFGAFVKQLKESSIYETGMDVAGFDHVVTLSTCSNTNRLVLSARRL